jgi:hypothetical protein
VYGVKIRDICYVRECVTYVCAVVCPNILSKTTHKLGKAAEGSNRPGECIDHIMQIIDFPLVPNFSDTLL